MRSTTKEHPPRTMMEVFQRLPEGTLAQVIENEFVLSPAPSEIHQKTLNEINFLLFSFVKKERIGEIRIAPYDVFLDRKNAFQPDIIFISNDNLHLIKEDGLHGVPDLVVEILSPSTAKYDLEEKKDVYERFGVKEYWIVDPATKSTQGYSLKEGTFGKTVKSKGLIHSKLLGTELHF